jgi:hypothetical protein
VDGWLFKPFGIEILRNRLESIEDTELKVRCTIS